MMTSFNQPLVSLITLNCNNTDLTTGFLESAQGLTYANVEIIVVDNNSKEDPTEKLKAAYPNVKIVYSKENMGFNGGNNLGIKAASGEYLFFINNDTEVKPDIIEGLLEVFDLYPDAGAVSPKIHFFLHPGTIQYAGYNPINIFTGRTIMIGNKQKDVGQYDEVKETCYAHGCGMMVHKKIVAEVGPWPEIFFIYYEELDWSSRIKSHGYKIYYQPKSLIYHKESMTTGKNSVFKTYYLTRNRILFMRRNTKKFPLTIFMIYLALVTIPKNTAVFLLHGEMDHLKAFWRGVSWNMKNLRNIKAGIISPVK